MNNGIIGTHLATNTPVEIELTTEEMELGLYVSVTGEEKWDTMCELVLERTGIETGSYTQLTLQTINAV